MDIFRTGADGEQWVEAVTDLETAVVRVTALGKSTPGKYLIYNQRTGNKVVIVVGDGSGDSKKSAG